MMKVLLVRYPDVGDGDEAAIRLPCLVSDTTSCSVHVKSSVGASYDRIPDIYTSLGWKGVTVSQCQKATVQGQK